MGASICRPCVDDHDEDEDFVIEGVGASDPDRREQWLCQPRIVMYNWPGVKSPFVCRKCGAEWVRADLR